MYLFKYFILCVIMLFAFYRIPLTNSVRFMEMVLCLFREVTVILEKLNTTPSDHIQPGKTLKLKLLHSCNTNVVFSESCGPHKFCWSACHNLCRPEVWYVNNNTFVVIGRGRAHKLCTFSSAYCTLVQSSQQRVFSDKKCS